MLDVNRLTVRAKPVHHVRPGDHVLITTAGISEEPRPLARRVDYVAPDAHRAGAMRIHYADGSDVQTFGTVRVVEVA